MNIKCQYCGSEFNKLIAEINRTKSHYCSKKCTGCHYHNHQRTNQMTPIEQDAETIMQILTDPENQPSQFGTVPLKWYENLENKLEKIRFNVGEVIDSLDGSYEKHAIRKKLQEAIEP